MKSFLAALAAVVLIGIGSAVILNSMQKQADTAYTTTGVRL